MGARPFSQTIGARRTGERSPKSFPAPAVAAKMPPRRWSRPGVEASLKLSGSRAIQRCGGEGKVILDDRAM
jgi:hypothetical protein